MGWDPETQQLQALSAEQAKNWTKGPVFHDGEEVRIKGLTFVIADIAPGQIKLKPKKGQEASKPPGGPKPDRSLGQIAYEGYFDKSGGKSLISGADLPGWNMQAEAIQQAWEAAARAVLSV